MNLRRKAMRQAQRADRQTLRGQQREALRLLPIALGGVPPPPGIPVGWWLRLRLQHRELFDRATARTASDADLQALQEVLNAELAQRLQRDLAPGAPEPFGEAADERIGITYLERYAALVASSPAAAEERAGFERHFPAIVAHAQADGATLFATMLAQEQTARRC